MADPYLLGLLAALAVTLAASVTDVRERRISNGLIVVGLVAAAALATTSGRWPDALAGSGLGMGTLALPRFIARDSVGFGDIKLVGVVGMSAGVSGVLAVIGLAIAAAAVALTVQIVRCRRTSERVIAFAPCLALGTAGHAAVALNSAVG
ncbi:MAG: A24 family peptidase [Chloroflexi bacterium]|nr:A24 family peptidase [Chloroflexota bacterium]